MSTNTIELRPHYQQQEQQLHAQHLTQKMTYLRSNWRSEGLPKDWRYLNGTGFHVKAQVDMLYAGLAESRDFAAGKETIHTWLNQTTQDIHGFNLEYLAEGLTFPIAYKISSDRQNVIAPLYGNKPVEELVSEQERNGVVKETVKKKLIPFFLYAPEGSLAMMSSPSGWSGLQMDNGKPIIFPDSQNYIFQKKGDEIVGFTIRTDLSYAEHREIIRRLSGQELNAVSPVEEYVSSVVYVDGSKEKKDITDIVDCMRDVRSESANGSQLAYKERAWSEIYKNLQQRDKLWKLDEITEQLTDRFNAYVMQGKWTRQELEEALAVTILDLSRAMGRRTSQSETLHYDDRLLFRQDAVLAGVSYGDTLRDVREKGGCAGGGSSNDKTLSLTSRNIFSGEEYSFDQPGPCRVCEADVPCGPCKICQPCDTEIRRKEQSSLAVESIASDQVLFAA